MGGVWVDLVEERIQGDGKLPLKAFQKSHLETYYCRRFLKYEYIYVLIYTPELDNKTPKHYRPLSMLLFTLI